MTRNDTLNQANSSIGILLPDKITLIAFIVFIIVSGAASVAIRFAYLEMPPFWSGAARFICGGLAGFLFASLVGLHG